jgi:hypothetical protein
VKLRKIIDLDNFPGIEVPLEVVRCPKCDAKLIISEIDAWSRGDDGRIIPEHFGLDCETEPDLDEDEDAWAEFFGWHYSMPYVDWLPLDPVIKAWLVENFDFVESKRELEKLARWTASVKGGEE